jgi:hypothetical protein
VKLLWQVVIEVPVSLAYFLFTTFKVKQNIKLVNLHLLSIFAAQNFKEILPENTA